MKAVNSEHDKNLEDDGWRIQRLAEEIASRTCPIHRFGTGSLKTLGPWKDEDLHLQLKKMWSTYFLARNMRLVLLGRESLDKLHKYAEKYFAAVPDHPVTPVKYGCDHKNVYPAEVLGSKIFYKPVQEFHRLILSFPMPTQLYNYRPKSVDMLVSMLSYFGEGSLLDVLKDAGWITSTEQAEISYDSSVFTLFGWAFELTEEGLKNIDAITQAFFAYIDLIKEKGKEEWRYEEMKELSKLTFDYKSKESPVGYVSGLARTLQVVPPADVLQSDLFFDYNQSSFEEILASIHPKNMIVYVLSHDIDKDLDKTEPWYKFQYAIESGAAEKMLSPILGNTREMTKKFQLAPKNDFVPRQLDQVSLETSSIPVLEQKPTVILEQGTPAVRLWFHQDTTFKLPYTTLLLKLWSPTPYSTARAYLLSGLYFNLLDDYLEHVTYQASLAGFRYEFNVGLLGVEISMKGFSDQALFAKFAQLIFGSVNNANVEFKEQRFQDMKDDMLKHLRNAGFKKPYEYAKDVLDSVLLARSGFHPLELTKALRQIELPDVLAFRVPLFSDIQVEGLAFGNLMPDDASELMQSILKAVPFSTASASLVESSHRFMSLKRPRISWLASGQHYTLETELIDPENENSVTLKYFQYGKVEDASVEVYGRMLDLVAQKLVYNQLRTVEQLGYVVWSYDRPMGDIAGFGIEVMSSVHNASFVSGRIDAVVPLLHQKVTDFTQSHENADLHTDPPESAQRFRSRHLLRKSRGAVTIENQQEDSATSNEEDDLQGSQESSAGTDGTPSFATFIDTLIGLTDQNYTTMDQQCGHFWDQIVSQELRFTKRLEHLEVLKGGKLSPEGLLSYFERVFSIKPVPLSGGVLDVQIDPARGLREPHLDSTNVDGSLEESSDTKDGYVTSDNLNNSSEESRSEKKPHDPVDKTVSILEVIVRAICRSPKELGIFCDAYAHMHELLMHAIVRRPSSA